MKFSVAYYLVLLYLLVLLKPLIPLIADTWNHEFNNLTHISLIHAKYGNNHLQKELSETASDKKGDKKQHIVNSPVDVSFHLVQPDLNFTFFEAVNNPIYLIFNFEATSFIFIQNQGPPPKVS